MPREKIKFALRIMPETQQLVKDYYPLDNCQSQSEFIEKAIRFYVSYIASKDATEFLAPILVTALQSTIKNMENHISKIPSKRPGCKVPSGSHPSKSSPWQAVLR